MTELDYYFSPCYNQIGLMMNKESDYYTSEFHFKKFRDTRKTKKRERFAFTTAQILALEDQFKQHAFVERDVRKRIATTLNLPEKVVKIWFQNRRMKEKKKNQENIEYCEEDVPVIGHNTEHDNYLYMRDAQFRSENSQSDTMSNGKSFLKNSPVISRNLTVDDQNKSFLRNSPVISSNTAVDNQNKITLTKLDLSISIKCDPNQMQQGNCLASVIVTPESVTFGPAPVQLSHKVAENVTKMKTPEKIILYTDYNNNIVTTDTHLMNEDTLKKRRERFAFTTDQTQALEAYFKKNSFIDINQRRNIAAVLKLPEKVVKIWFQNRRMKEKKNSVDFEDQQEAVRKATETNSSPKIQSNNERYPNLSTRLLKRCNSDPLDLSQQHSVAKRKCECFNQAK